MSHTTHVPRVSINDTIDVDHVTLSADADPNSSLPTFQSRSLWVPIGARGAFGGQTIAQALVAAGRTVSPLMGLHSQSTYFLWPAAGHLRVTYEVETLRDGKNFASRLVRARQEGKICIIVTCSFTTSDGQSGTSKGQGPPFGFLTTPTAPPPPSSGKAEGKSKGKQSYVSRSLQFAVGSSQHHSATESKFAGRPFAVRTPPFRPRVQIPFPRHVVPYEQSEPEEQRWARWLSRKGITWDHPSRTVVEEYIQVRSAHLRRKHSDRSRKGEVPPSPSLSHVCITTRKRRMVSSDMIAGRHGSARACSQETGGIPSLPRCAGHGVCAQELTTTGHNSVHDRFPIHRCHRKVLGPHS